MPDQTAQLEQGKGSVIMESMARLNRELEARTAKKGQPQMPDQTAQLEKGKGSVIVEAMARLDREMKARKS